MILEHWIIAEISAVHRRRFQRVDTRRKAFSEIYKVRSIEEEQAGITTEISVIEVIRTSNKIAKFWVLRKFAEICEICEFEFCENLRKFPQKHTKRLRARCHIPRLAWSWETERYAWKCANSDTCLDTAACRRNEHVAIVNEGCPSPKCSNYERCLDTADCRRNMSIGLCPMTRPRSTSGVTTVLLRHFFCLM